MTHLPKSEGLLKEFVHEYFILTQKYLKSEIGLYIGDIIIQFSCIPYHNNYSDKELGKKIRDICDNNILEQMEKEEECKNEENTS